MNLVFRNSLDKQVGEGRVVTAQVSICEVMGQYRVLWDEPNDDGVMDQSLWYEGTSWDEMLTVFRYQLLLKIGSGYEPVLDPMVGNRAPRERQRQRWMLDYYSELHTNELVYEQLRQWRRSQAIEEGKSAYLIATNRELRLLSAFLPYTEEELLLIPGFGPNKSSRYGEAILALTSEVERSTGFPLDWVEQRIDIEPFNQWLLAQQEASFKKEMDKQANKRNLLEGIRQGVSIAELQVSLSLSRREILQWIETLADEGYDVDPLIDRELTEMPETEQVQVWQSFESLGDRFLKPVLEKVYGEGALKGKLLDEAYERLRLIRLRYRKEQALLELASADAAV